MPKMNNTNARIINHSDKNLNFIGEHSGILQVGEDKSLIQRLHGGWPRVFHIEGKK